MPRTTQCTQCGIVLNLPDHAIGKRLKCPRCGTRFGAVPGDDASPDSSFLLQKASPSSPQMDTTQRPASSADALPTSSGKVSDAVDIPLLNEMAAGGKATAVAGTKTATSAKQIGDAMALFEDGAKKPPRRPNAAEARAKPRRCPTCGGVVPAGMSLCGSCGLDLETGTRIVLEDDLTPPTPPPQSLPLAISIIGGVCLLGSLVFTITTLSLWLRGYDGYQYFVPICLFGVFAAAQFLRLKTAKLLLMALTFGLLIDIVALIAMPIYRANVEIAPIEPAVHSGEIPGAEMIIPPVTEKLDTRSLTLGLSLIAVYAAVAYYLISPQVRRHFR